MTAALAAALGGGKDDTPEEAQETEAAPAHPAASIAVRSKKTHNRKPRTMTRKPSKQKATKTTAHRNSAKAKDARRKPTVKPALRATPNPAPEPMVKLVEPSQQPSFPSNIDDSRQAFVVLAWFEYLLKRIPSNELPFLIDQYRKIGWIDDRLHTWFIKMAQGVGGTRTKAGETAFARQGARGLVTIHKETLRFLKQLRAAAVRPVMANGAGLEKIVAHK